MLFTNFLMLTMTAEREKFNWEWIKAKTKVCLW